MLHDLTVEQQNTIDRLVAGDTDEQAAKAAGVHRVTVSRWRSHDPTFQAALNARRQEVWGASADKLRSLVPKALDALARAMGARSDVQAAVTILKAASLDKLPPPGPTDPEEIFEALVEARVKEKRAKRDRNQIASDLKNELSDPCWRARKEAEDTAAAKAEIEAEIEARLNDAADSDVPRSPAAKSP
jgi:FixJ family two-component response regulator